jgi:hypothetical protein
MITVLPVTYPDIIQFSCHTFKKIKYYFNYAITEQMAKSKAMGVWKLKINILAGAASKLPVR